MSGVTICCKSTKQCGKMAACLNTVVGDQKRMPLEQSLPSSMMALLLSSKRGVCLVAVGGP